MALFKYRARDNAGKKIEGLMPARSKSELAHTLKNQGMLLVFAMEENAKEGGKKGGDIYLKRVSLAEKMIFIKNLGVMIKAGIPIPRALEILSKQTKARYFKEILTSLREDVQTGKSLSECMMKYPKVFPPLFSSTIRIGEMGGSLEEVLEVLAIQLEKENGIRTKVKGAMIYPSVIVFAMVIIGILIMIFVVPSLTKIFTDMDIPLPLTTRIIIGSSGFLRDNMLVTLVALIALPVGFIYFKGTPKGKKALHYLILHAPIINNISQKVNTARFSRSLSSLLKSGVSIVKALEIISESLDNVYFQEALLSASKKVQKGSPLNKSIEDRPDLFPPMVAQMIKVGEETGSSEQVLAQLADFYEREVDELTKNLSSVIEPVLIMFIGGAVGVFAISVIQPMYSVMDYM